MAAHAQKLCIAYFLSVFSLCPKLLFSSEKFGKTASAAGVFLPFALPPDGCTRAENVLRMFSVFLLPVPFPKLLRSEKLPRRAERQSLTGKKTQAERTTES